MDLFDIYADYRSGNKSAFDRIFTDRVEGLGCENYYSTLEINIQKLNNLVNELHRKKCKSVNRNSYSGDFDDLKKDLALILFQIFNDKNFTAHSEQELYEKIKDNILDCIKTK